MNDIISTLGISKLIIILILTILPSVILFSLILYSDRKSREPLLMILICAFSGAFTICLSLLLDKLVLKFNLLGGGLFTDANSYSIYRILIFAFVEEYSKVLVLYLFLFKNKSYDDIFDGFVYSSITALSFSLVETFLYVINEQTYADMSSLAVLRNFTAIPLHLVCGISMGYFLSLEKFSKSKKRKLWNMALALLVPTTIHTVYNVFFSIVSLTDTSVVYALVIILFVLSIYLIGIMFIWKTRLLNRIFVSNGVYPKRKRYLMTKNDFMLKESEKLV